MNIMMAELTKHRIDHDLLLCTILYIWRQFMKTCGACVTTKHSVLDVDFILKTWDENDLDMRVRCAVYTHAIHAIHRC